MLGYIQFIFPRSDKTSYNIVYLPMKMMSDKTSDNWNSEIALNRDSTTEFLTIWNSEIATNKDATTSPPVKTTPQ